MSAKFIEYPTPGKTCVVVGTRPGIIKMSPIIEELAERPVESFVIHAGQHYSHRLSAKIFDDLRLPNPDHHLEEVRETTHHGEQTAAMLEGIERILLSEQPENVLVCGDANFNLAGALAARKLRLSVGHVEAGLRSDDWRMPEEHNRVIIDHISDYLFAPTAEAERNALEDNVNGEVYVTGNTVVDALERNLPIARQESTTTEDLDIEGSEYVVFTAHREENVDDEATLTDLVEILQRVCEERGFTTVYPMHPRTEERLEEFDLGSDLRSMDGLKLTDPLGYLDFVKLLADARIALTDSGGIQEESCILSVPCVTLRENTERPETVEVGSNRVAGTDPDPVMRAFDAMLDIEPEWENPFGDGSAASRIIDAMTE